MDSEWSDLPLGKVITLQRGFDLPAQDRKPGKIPIVSSSGISGYHSEIGVKGPGVVTGRYGTIGQVFLLKEDYWPLNTTLWVKDFHGNDPQFTSYLLRTIDFQSCSDKSSVPGVNRNDLHQIPVKVPPLPEQKAIAAALGALDDKIDLNRRMNATLEAMARSLFQSWFIDFDPVRAKLDGRRATGLDPATAALFPNDFEDSELGHIPKGWMAQRLPDAVEVNPRRMLKRGVVAPYLDMKNLPTQGHSAEEVIDREFSSGTKFQNGDTLLARITPCLENGKTGYVDFLEDGQVGWGSTEYIILAPKPPLPPQFAYLLARSDALRSHAIQNMTGTSGRQRVPSECFNTFFLAVPTPDIARCFDELTAPIMVKIKANSNESRTLATLRDKLLPELMAGRLSTSSKQ
jgi:type I restriction enzyme, S subunit